jgi:hypothetical protein
MLGFSLNPFRLIKKIIKPALVVGSMFVPGGALVRTAAQAVAGKIASRRGGGAGTPSISPWRRRIATIRAQALMAAKAQAQPAATFSTETITTAGPAMAPAGGGAAGGGGGFTTAAEESDATPATTAGQGIGIGIAVIAGLALLALSRKR